MRTTTTFLGTLTTIIGAVTIARGVGLNIDARITAIITLFALAVVITGGVLLQRKPSEVTVTSEQPEPVDALASTEDVAGPYPTDKSS
ncbi:hypothetical protein [Arcanobacterium ihumii]|uniref:hypothetical protein n=1 Tax=Arcanobacterium ihumii TaxID=2138162 RepID=UPI000F54441A|nr:hypothetical protein [Arcanobacterium ihumii]